MTCQTMVSLMDRYVDGELDAAQSADVERHLSECAECAAAYERLSRLARDLRAYAPRYEASELLRARVLRGVRQEAVSARRPAVFIWALAASVLLALSIGWNVMMLRSRNAEASVAQEIVSSHIRSLIGDHLLDVPSTDQHNVKPWFNGKLDYAPDVKDFASAGYPLIGGRVDYIGHKPVAALVYKRRQHVINLFVWPSGLRPTTPETENGFNLVAWYQAGMGFCAISDLNAEELRQFTDLYRR